jgi:competence protein ComGF
MTTYYENHKEYFKEYYRNYHLKHREKMIDKSTAWYLANEEHRVKHAIACKKYLMKNKKDVYGKRRVKYVHKVLMKELLNYFK